MPQKENQKKQTKQKEQAHSPTLNTIIMIENTLKSIKMPISVAELKRNIPKQVNHNTLMTILEYLEESKKILMTIKGITWVHNPNPNLR